MKTYSWVTGRYYEPTDMVCITNINQIAKYIKNGATLYDLMETNGLLVGVFSKRETKPLYEKWVKFEL